MITMRADNSLSLEVQCVVYLFSFGEDLGPIWTKFPVPNDLWNITCYDENDSQVEDPWMILPYMLKNWAKISVLSEDGETKSSEIEKVILCAYNSLLHSFCRSPQTHLVFGDHWRGTWSLLSPLVSTPCAWLNCHLLFTPFLLYRIHFLLTD